MKSSFDEINHLGRRVDRQRMLCEAGPWRDIRCHFANQVELPIGCFCEQCDHDILQRNDTNSQLHQLSIAQHRTLGWRITKNQGSLDTSRDCAALIIPSRECPETHLLRLEDTRCCQTPSLESATSRD